LVELQSGLDEITKDGTAFWAVNFDTPETLVTVKKKLKLTYPLLSDSDSKIIELYGLRNSEMDKTKKAGVAVPTILLISQDGTIKTLFADSTRKRHGSADIVKAINEAAK